MAKLSDTLLILKGVFPDLDLSIVRDSEVNLVVSSSQEVNAGAIFVAVPGTKSDGHQYLADALKSGAAFIIGEWTQEKTGIQPEQYLQVPDSRLALGLLASQIEGNPSREMLVIGVTGTSGKTTTSFLIESILKAAGKTVGLIGTVSFRINGEEVPSTHTTPGPVELHRLIRLMRTKGCNALVMEVSSHALKQHRTAGVAFDAAVFTNLSAEHLDYHPSMEDYFSSKKMLFQEQAILSRKWGKKPISVVHVGNTFGDRLLREIPKATAFSVPSDAVINTDGITGAFAGIAIQSKLMGRFNAENIAAAIAVMKALPVIFGITDAHIKTGIDSLSRVPGRLEQVFDPKGGRIILVDYAHKPDALEKVLEVLRPMRALGKKLICVFGCGGDRDRGKRAVMGEIACRLSDEVVLTSDNPRTEDPNEILAEIEKGCVGFSNWKRLADRKLAIETAIASTGPGDLVLIAGKGHEDYQIIGSEKYPFDDREVAQNHLK